jgi:hypothetical protein
MVGNDAGFFVRLQDVGAEWRFFTAEKFLPVDTVTNLPTVAKGSPPANVRCGGLK